MEKIEIDQLNANSLNNEALNDELLDDETDDDADDDTFDEADTEEDEAEEVEETVKSSFVLETQKNSEYVLSNLCCKRARKLIYRPNEVLFEKTYTVNGTNDKNEEGVLAYNIIEKLISDGLKRGSLDRYDGLKSSELKEDYVNEAVFEYAEQEFKKAGLLLENGKLKVYLFDWDRKNCFHIGYLTAFDELLAYLQTKDEYSFDLSAIITGGALKRVVSNGGKVTIKKEKGEPFGIDLDVSIIKRKD